MLNNLFEPTTVSAILSIPFPSCPSVDMLFWWPYTDGLYRVKSVYQLRLKLNNPKTPGLNGDDDRELWKKIWKISIPPKAQHFLWRLGKESLAVNLLRHHRHCADSPGCSRCNSDRENFFHALVECPKSAPILSNNSEAAIISAAPKESSKLFLKWVLNHTSKEEQVIDCASLWVAWFVRNKHCLENSTIDLVQTTTTMIKGMHEYELLLKKQHVNKSPGIPSSPKWILPMEGWMKINFDAMVKDCACNGLGVVLRNSCDKLIARGTLRLRQLDRGDL